MIYDIHKTNHNVDWKIRINGEYNRDLYPNSLAIAIFIFYRPRPILSLVIRHWERVEKSVRRCREIVSSDAEIV